MSMPLLATAADDGVALWDGGDEPRLRFAPHSASISALRWTANDRVLASASLDGAVVLSEPDGALFDTLRPTAPPNSRGPIVPIPVLAIAWSPASRYLASGSADALVRIFDLQKREHALTLRGQRSGVCALSWSPSEVHVASASALGDVLVHRVQVRMWQKSESNHQSASLGEGGLRQWPGMRWPRARCRSLR